MRVTIFERALRLRHTFTIARGSREVNENLFLRLEHEGITAWGEASPNRRYGETPASCRATLERLCEALPETPRAYDPLLRSLAATLDGQYAALAALDMALFDWLGKSLHAPLYQIWGLDPATLPPTSLTISIDTPENVRARVRDAADFQILKIKLGGSHDRDMIRAIREVSDQALRVDANEAWHDREHALREIEWLARHKVELVEQPMPADRWEDMAWLKARSPLPLIADEAFSLPEDLLRIRKAFHGVNIKLMKCGGLVQARDALALARTLGLKTMLGCMIESSVAIAAAAQLAPLVDYADLDGNLLLADDPFLGHSVRGGRLFLNERPGLGVSPGPGWLSDSRQVEEANPSQ